jgi:Tol biopolymer transport system component
VAIIPWRLVAQEPRQEVPSAAQQTAADNSVKLPGKIYVWAALDFTTPVGASDKYRGFVIIDPNTGDWEKFGPSGHSLRVSSVDKRFTFDQTAISSKDPKKPGVADIFTMDTTDGQAKNLVKNGDLPIWSPDGKQILFNRTIGEPEGDAQPPRESWIVDLAGGNSEKLPIPKTDEVDDWSLKGNWLVTVSDRHPPFGSGYQLYVMHPDGSDEKRITEGTGLNCYPRFSPDGKQIVYLHQRGLDSLWTVAADGSNPKQVLASDSDGSNSPQGACWSPDGKWLAIQLMNWQSEMENGKQTWRRGDHPNDRLAILAPDGSNQKVLKLKNVTKIGFLEQSDWK